MSIYSKILVVANLNSDEQPALARAVQLAKKSKSRSHISFFLSIYDFSYDMTSMLSHEERDAMRRGVIHQREEWMRNVAKPFLDDSFDLDVKVVWHNRPYVAIVEEVFEGQKDIVIKATRKHDILESVIFTQRTGTYFVNVRCLFFSLKMQTGQRKQISLPLYMSVQKTPLTLISMTAWSNSLIV